MSLRKIYTRFNSHQRKDIDLRKQPWRGIYTKVKELRGYNHAGFTWAYMFYDKVECSKSLLHLDKKFENEFYNKRWERFVELNKVVKSYVNHAQFGRLAGKSGWIWINGNQSIIVEIPESDISIEDFEIQVSMAIL